MRLSELKEHLYDLVSTYFTEGAVVWSHQYLATPHYPLTTIRTGAVQIATFPFVEFPKGVPDNRFAAQVKLEINRYTSGRNKQGEALIDAENTATDELLGFILNLGSQRTISEMARLDISIFPAGPIQDLTNVLNDTRYQFRAMVELDVSFMADIAEPGTGYFEKAEIKERKT